MSLAVVLESPEDAPTTFRGFLIQARLVADDRTVVGQFVSPPVGGEYRYGSCAKVEVDDTVQLVASCRISPKGQLEVKYVVSRKGGDNLCICTWQGLGQPDLRPFSLTPQTPTNQPY